MNDVFFSKKTDDWATPSEIYDTFMSFGFYDPCPYQSKTNLYGMVHKGKRIYINPPFSQNKMWIKYAIDLSKDNDVWLLIACRTDTAYFRALFEACHPVLYFITGRISFNDRGHAPFPVVFIHLCNAVSLYRCVTQNEFIEFLQEFYKKY